MISSGSGSGKIYLFDDVSVDGENFRVQKGGQTITLTPRAFDVLIFLLKHDGRAVEKQELFDRVWKDTIVTDNALTKIIKEIRHALEDSAETPRYIETVTKRGYRFIGEIRERPAPPEPETGAPAAKTRADESDRTTAENLPRPNPRRQLLASKRAAFLLPAFVFIALAGLIGWLYFGQKPAKTSPPRSLAVLPFKPLNADSRDESLEMGMAETLITRLSNLDQIVVRPVSAVRKYTDLQQDPVAAGQEIKAEAVLDGSIQKAGERVRVTVRLIDVSNGTTLWSDRFDENFTDIFKVQDSIAERIANALTLRLSRHEKERIAKHFTENAEAYQLYLRAQLIWHARRTNWITESLSYYQQAIEKDPNFALAYIGAADCYIMLSGHRRLSMHNAEIKARPNIMKALELDNNLAQAHNALAELKYQYEYDWATAEKEFRKAIELNPNVAWNRQAYGWFLMSQGLFEEAAAEMEKARELDPSSITVNVGRGRLLYYSRQFDRALQHFQNVIAVEPNDSSAYYSLYTIYEQKRMYPEAVEAFLKSMELNAPRPETIESFREAFKSEGWNGYLRKQLEFLERRARNGRANPHTLANLYLRLGRKDEAFAHFEKAFEARDPSILQFKVEPAYDALRDDPRYVELLRKIGLKP